MAELTTRITSGVRPLKPAQIPSYIADGAARATLRAIERYFENPAVKADYIKWLKQQKAKETE